MAFYKSGLQYIEIPASVEIIAKGAFQDCIALTTVTFEPGSKLKTIGGRNSEFYNLSFGAFHGCTSLTGIEIPASVEIIEGGAFQDCIALTTVTFEPGSKLKTIGGGFYYEYYHQNLINDYFGAFLNCTSLTTIEIPASVEIIELTAFKGCTALTTVTFEPGSKLKTIEGNTPNSGYTTLSYGAFADCISLTAIEIPANVETIEAGAFHNCTALTTVTFEQGSLLKALGDHSYSSGPYGAFSNCTLLTSIEIPASVEEIGSSAFQGCTALKNVTFEKGSQLKIIGAGSEPDNAWFSYPGAFADCISLTAIEIPANVEIIEAGAFHNCTALTTVTFEQGSLLKALGRYSECSHAIPEGVFSNCKSITSINIPSSVEVIGISAFKNCTALKKVTFAPDSQLKMISFDVNPSIDDCGAFYNCTSLTTIEIPHGVETIGLCAFQHSGLQSIEIPASVKTIGVNAFYKCSSLTTVTFEKGSQLKEMNGFSHSGLQSIEIPASVETIWSAFENCTALTTVTFEKGSQLKRIGMFSFSYCSSLRLFEIGMVTPPDVESSFNSLPSFSILKVPAESVEAYKKATGWNKFSNISALD